MATATTLRTIPTHLHSPPPPATVASYTAAIRHAAAAGRHLAAAGLYLRMLRLGLRPDRLTFPSLLKSWSDLPTASSSASAIHAHVAKSPSRGDAIVATALLSLYSKTGRFAAARTLFDEMPHRDAAAWNCIMTGVAGSGSWEEVLGFFRRMRLEDVSPDGATATVLARMCGVAGKTGCLRAVHSLAVRIGVGGSVAVANTLVAAYSKCEDLASAEGVFGEIHGEVRSVVSWNAMIGGYAYLRRHREAMHLFRCMGQGGLRPDISTVLSLLSSLADSGSVVEGMLVHSLVVKSGMDADVSVVNTLISFFAKCGDVDAARVCFDRIVERTVVSWTALIGGYSQKGDVGEAMALFSAMEAAGVKPDAFAVVAVLSACGQAGAIELGRSMENCMKANGLDDDIFANNALIDMYAKCGNVGIARRVFDRMRGRTVVSWTAMIMGYATNGDFGGALGLFSQMVEAGLKPNHVTFLAVLQACVHGGMLVKGWDFFDQMNRVHNMTPRLEHYACMVDLLGRRGRLKEALDFIQSMPVKPDAGVWGALLGACITHHETDIGEYAASRLFDLEPQTAVSYVGIANIYAAKQKWEGVSEIRAMMREKNAIKCPGQSIIEVDGDFHSFVVEERSHPKALQIYEVLDALIMQLTQPDDEEDFEEMLTDDSMEVERYHFLVGMETDADLLRSVRTSASVRMRIKSKSRHPIQIRMRMRMLHP